MWCEAALHTPLRGYSVFTDRFGMEDPDALVGVLDETELAADYEQRIKDALTVHDRIADVTEFSLEREGDVVTLSFAITTDAGQSQPLTVEVRG